MLIDIELLERLPQYIVLLHAYLTKLSQQIFGDTLDLRLAQRVSGSMARKFLNHDQLKVLLLGQTGRNCAEAELQIKHRNHKQLYVWRIE